MPTSPAGLRYPALTAAPNVPQDMSNLVTDLDKKVVPVFASTATRDTAYPSPTAGQVVFVSGNNAFYEYVNGAWRRRDGQRYGAVMSFTGRVIGAGGGTTEFDVGSASPGWQNEQDNGGFGVADGTQSATPVTIPTGGGGLYDINCYGIYSIEPTGRSYIGFRIGGTQELAILPVTYRTLVSTTEVLGVISLASLPLQAGQTIRPVGWHVGPGSRTLDVVLTVFRRGA